MFAVGLAAGHHRDHRELFGVGRDHVVRQPVAQVLIDLGGVHCGRVPARAVVRDELDRIGPGLVGVDHRLRDARHLQQDRLDLGQFHPVTADLDLGVYPAVVLDLTIGVHPAQIAGPVDPARRILRDTYEVRYERALGQRGAVEVPAGEADPRDTDLPHRSGRDGPVRVRIQHHHRIGRQRDPDRHRPARIQHRPGGRHGGLGRAVDVEKPPACPVPAGHQVLRAGLTRHQQETQPGKVVLQRGQQRRHTAQGGDAALKQEVVQLRAEQVFPARLGHQGRPGHPGHPDLLHREVERDRHALVNPIVAGHAVHLGCHLDEVADAGMLDRHPLRPTGRARGVDDVTQVIDRVPDLARAETISALGGDRAIGLIQVQQPGRAGQTRGAIRQVRSRQHQSDPRVGDDVGQPIRREPGIEGNVRRVDFQHRKHAGVAVHRPVEQQPHPVTRPHAPAQQETR